MALTKKKEKIFSFSPTCEASWREKTVRELTLRRDEIQGLGEGLLEGLPELGRSRSSGGACWGPGIGREV